jgi:hypothetical protein
MSEFPTPLAAAPSLPAATLTASWAFFDASWAFAEASEVVLAVVSEAVDAKRRAVNCLTAGLRTSEERISLCVVEVGEHDCGDGG